jgi:ribonuclease BN (tRNA processing enzyme)
VGEGVVRLTVFGGAGAWPDAGQACSGYLVEHDGFRLLVDPGFAVLPHLFAQVRPHEVDAVLVTHEHPDHCADLNPLLRARRLSAPASRPLQVYSADGALDAVLALDRPDMRLDTTCVLNGLSNEDIGPFRVAVAALPHFVPNLGVRLTAGGTSLVYTGDCAASEELVTLARGADLLLAEASFAEQVPERLVGGLSTAADVAAEAAAAGVGHLVLTHLIGVTDPAHAREVAARTYTGRIDVARIGLTVDV